MSMEKDFSIEEPLQDYVRDSLESVALQFLRGVILASPRDKGTFQANWVVGINSIDSGVYPQRTNANNAINRGGAVIKKLTYSPNMTINVSNNLPYAARLNNGYSDQSPKFFVEIAARNAGVNLKDGDL
tara:strand:+ start:21 stop:407 length:387 start_codon:yes stop_codon:yes gene_type:complete